MTETWLPIAGYEGTYEVSDQGRVRSIDRVATERNTGRLVRKRGRVLSPAQHRNGQLHLHLWKDGIGKVGRVHRLVLETFVGACPDGMEACHANDDPTDNRLINRRWDTRSSNRDDRVRN